MNATTNAPVKKTVTLKSVPAERCRRLQGFVLTTILIIKIASASPDWFPVLRRSSGLVQAATENISPASARQAIVPATVAVKPALRPATMVPEPNILHANPVVIPVRRTGAPFMTLVTATVVPTGQSIPAIPAAADPAAPPEMIIQIPAPVQGQGVDQVLKASIKEVIYIMKLLRMIINVVLTRMVGGMKVMKQLGTVMNIVKLMGKNIPWGKVIVLLHMLLRQKKNVWLIIIANRMSRMAIIL